MIEIVQTKDKYFRYVDHDKKLLTTGFLNKDTLNKYTFRWDESSAKYQRIRYHQYFNEGKEKIT